MDPSQMLIRWWNPTGLSSHQDKSVFQIRIRFLRIRILDFFRIPDPGSGSRQKNSFFQRQKQNVGRNFRSQPNIIFVFNQSSTGRYFIKQRTFIWYLSFLKVSENHEKCVKKVDFYSSLSGSGFRIRIRIHPGNLNPDHPDPDPKHCSTVPTNPVRSGLVLGS